MKHYLISFLFKWRDIEIISKWRDPAGWNNIFKIQNMGIQSSLLTRKIESMKADDEKLPPISS